MVVESDYLFSYHLTCQKDNPIRMKNLYLYIDEIRSTSIFPLPIALIFIIWIFYPIGLISLVGLAVWSLLPLYWRSFYYRVKPFRGEHHSDFANRKRTFLLKQDFLQYTEDPSQCKLCKKHPVNKKYHLPKVHEITSSRGGCGGSNKDNDINISTRSTSFILVSYGITSPLVFSWCRIECWSRELAST